MSPSELHPEPLIERERHAGVLDPISQAQLDEHLARCAACAMERTLARGFDDEAEPDEADRERAARVVALMFAGDTAPFDVPEPHDGISVDNDAEDATEANRGAPEPRRELPLAVSLAVSLAVHAVLVAAVLLLATAIDVPRDPIQPMEITWVEAPETRTLSTEMEREEAPLAPSPEAAPRAVESRRGRPSTASVEPANVEPGAIGATVSPVDDAPLPLEPGLPEESVAARRQRLAVLLAPGNVARGGFVVEGQPSRRGGPAGIAPLHDRGPSGAEIGRSLGGGLRAQAMTKAYITREHPQLRRRSDGTQVYEGPRFAAVILPDGSVEFQDHGNVQGQGFSGSGTFDLTEAIMGAAGQDPLAAERDWFMRETEELRHGLEAQHRREVMSSALRTLQGRLARVWATTDRSPTARRRRIFSMWDDMAEDDTGREARRVVVEFVRQTLPVGSEHAYTDAELARLNASRESRAEFAPY